MSSDRHSDERRRFIKSAVLGAAGVGTAWSVGTPAASEATRTTKKNCPAIATVAVLRW